MHTSILIPTDFQPSSLNAVKKVVEDLGFSGTVSITLVHGYFLSDSITDLLFHSPSKIVRTLSNQSFVEGCQLLQNKYASVIKDLSVSLFHGYTDGSFQQFCAKRGITKAYIPRLSCPSTVSKSSFDVSDLIRKNLSDVVEFEVLLAQDFHTDSVSDLFLKEI